MTPQNNQLIKYAVTFAVGMVLGIIIYPAVMKALPPATSEKPDTK